MRKGQVLDQIEDLLAKCDSAEDKRSIIKTLAADHNVKLEGGGGKGRGLGSDQFGEAIEDDDEVLEGSNIFGGVTRVNLSGVDRQMDRKRNG